MHCDVAYYRLIRLMMPRVVTDQQRKFDTEELFITLSRPTEVRYAGLALGNEEERRERFLSDCRDGRIEIACIPSGVNLDLYVATTTAAMPPSSDVPASSALDVQQSGLAGNGREWIDYTSDPTKVQILCHLIMNGVCIRWRGWINPNTLRGQGCVEFDEERARIEDQLLQQELQAINQRLRYMEHHQPYLRGLAIPTIPAEMLRTLQPHAAPSIYPPHHGAPAALSTTAAANHRFHSSASTSPITTTM